MNKLYGLLALGAVALGLIAMAPQNESILNASNKWALVMENFCSAQVIDAEKEYILTAGHCASNTKAVFWKRYFNPDGTEDKKKMIRYEATRVAISPETDVAVYQLDYGDLTDAVKIADEPVEYMDTVYAVGNPSMHFRTISEGKIIKPTEWFDQVGFKVNVVYFDAFMDGGSSGGALLNAQGELIGLTNFMFPGKFMRTSVAVDVKHVKDVLDKLDETNNLKYWPRVEPK
jgi:S1-C subfamily serine protease